MFKKINVGNYSLTPKIITQVGAFVESHLKVFFESQVEVVKDHEQIKSPDFDIGLVQAQELELPEFLKWLDSFEKKRADASLIQVPFIIVTPISPADVAKLFVRVVETNWYFDLVHPMQLQSLPIRVANLIRIKLHIEELQRYNLELDQMAEKIAQLEEKLKTLK